MSGKKWYAVTVEERYSATYTVRAEDAEEAEDMVNDLVNQELVDPAGDNPDSYGRATYTDETEKPKGGGVPYWEYRDGRLCSRKAGGRKGSVRR